jgi:hypothetical protein
VKPLRTQRLDRSFYIFFAGFPLKRVAATGIAHPGTNGEIYLFIVRAQIFGGEKKA